MQNFLGFFSVFVILHSFLAYAVLFLGILFEGEFFMILAGILVHLGVFSPLVVFIVAIAASISKMYLGYYLGQYLGKKFKRTPILKFLERRVLFFLPAFREKPFWSIVLSKFIYGVNNLALVFAGYVSANRRKYFLAEIMSSAVWLSAMFGLGYFFSHLAFSISNNLRNFILLVLLFIIGFIILQKLINLSIEIFEELWLEEKNNKNESIP